MKPNRKPKVDKFDYNVTTAPTTNDTDLFSAAVNIVIPVKDWIFMGCALMAPVILYFVLKLVTKKIA